MAQAPVRFMQPRPTTRRLAPAFCRDSAIHRLMHTEWRPDQVCTPHVLHMMAAWRWTPHA